jgi:hypothetical protein
MPSLTVGAAIQISIIPMTFCPICKRTAKPLDKVGDWLGFDCERHGRFKVALTVFEMPGFMYSSIDQWEAASVRRKRASPMRGRRLSNRMTVKGRSARSAFALRLPATLGLGRKPPAVRLAGKECARGGTCAVATATRLVPPLKAQPNSADDEIGLSCRDRLWRTARPDRP